MKTFHDGGSNLCRSRTLIKFMLRQNQVLMSSPYRRGRIRMQKCLLVHGVKLGFFVGLILDVNSKKEAVFNRTEGRVWKRRLEFQLIIGFKCEEKLCELVLTATVSSHCILQLCKRHWIPNTDNICILFTNLLSYFN